MAEPRTGPDSHSRSGEGTSGRDRLGDGVLALVALVVYVRLYFGIDFTDESYYTALPYSFALGHRPLVDELAVHQFAGMLLRAPVDLHLLIVGSSTGLVLTMRHVHFAAALAAALFFRGFGIAIFGRRTAGLLGSVALAYVPFNIFGLSYNTIASLASMTGAVLLAGACLDRGRPSRVFFATLALALACFAYPTLSIAIGPCLLLALAQIRRLKGAAIGRQALIWCLAAVSVSAALALWQLISVGGLDALDGVFALNQALAAQGGGAVKIARLAKEAAVQKVYLTGLLVLLAGITLAYARLGGGRWILIASGLFGPLLLALHQLHVHDKEPQTSASFVLSAMGLAAPFALRSVRGRVLEDRWVSLSLVTALSVLSGVTVAWSSANGLHNAALGLLPAALIFLGGLQLLGPISEQRSGAAALALTLLICSLLGFQLTQLWTKTYRAGPMRSLTEVVPQGPWKWIRTTPSRARLIEQLSRDIEETRGDSQTVLFFDYFPAGYLMSDLEPRTPAIWLFPGHCCQGTPAAREVYAAAFEDERRLPDLNVRMRCMWVLNVALRLRRPPALPPDPVVERLDAVPSEEVARRRCYTIHRSPAR